MTLKQALEDAIKKLQILGGIEFGGEVRDITSNSSSYLAFNLLGKNGQPKVVFKVEQRKGALSFTFIVAEEVWSKMDSKILDDIRRKYKVTPTGIPFTRSERV